MMDYAMRIDRLLDKIALRHMTGNCFGDKHGKDAETVREHVWLFFRSIIVTPSR